MYEFSVNFSKSFFKGVNFDKIFKLNAFNLTKQSLWKVQTCFKLFLFQEMTEVSVSRFQQNIFS